MLGSFLLRCEVSIELDWHLYTVHMQSYISLTSYMCSCSYIFYTINFHVSHDLSDVTRYLLFEGGIIISLMVCLVQPISRWYLPEVCLLGVQSYSCRY